jgi:hypothetical protein
VPFHKTERASFLVVHKDFSVSKWLHQLFENDYTD